MKATDIDSTTLAYIERVSGKSGQEAVDCYMQCTGWARDKQGRYQLPQHVRLQTAQRMAAAGPRRFRAEYIQGASPARHVLI